MKRYNNLFTKVYALENIRLAHENAQRGKSHYREVKMLNSDPEKYFLEIQDMLKNKTFCNSKYEKIIRVMDNGKVREIYKLPYFPDRIIHHCIVQVMEDIWTSTFIKETYSCIKGRGIHKCMKKIKRDLLDRENTKYCLKMDVKKFYPSVDHNILKHLLNRKIKDKDMMWILSEIIDSMPGVPIGNYLSQYFGNIYLSYFDHWMKEQKNCKYYYRYCDDIVVLSDSKSTLHRIRREVDEYFRLNLKLEMKKNWQVFPVASRGIDFLGYRFFHGYTLLRKSIAKRFVSKANNIRRNWEKMSYSSVVNGIMSYYGWVKHGNCKNLLNKHIDGELFWIVKQKAKEVGISNPLQGRL